MIVKNIEMHKLWKQLPKAIRNITASNFWYFKSFMNADESKNSFLNKRIHYCISLERPGPPVY